MSSNLYWILWLIATLVTFGVYEFRALFRKRVQDTLSVHLRAWFHTQKTPGKIAWGVVWGVFSIAMFVHIMFTHGWPGRWF